MRVISPKADPAGALARLAELSASGKPAPDWLPRLVEQSENLQWDPYDIDLSKERGHWLAMAPEQQQCIGRVIKRFDRGEYEVYVTLNPLIKRFEDDGHFAMAAHLRTFQAEEGKHAVFFQRYLREVMHEDSGVGDPYSQPFRRLFCEILPQTLDNVRRPGWRNVIRALTTYMLVCEGAIAETAYFGFEKALKKPDGVIILPGLYKGIGLTALDESRHVAFGLQALTDRVREQGFQGRLEVLSQIGRLIVPALGCAGMVHREFHPFPFEHVKLEDLQRKARHKICARVEKVVAGTSWFTRNFIPGRETAPVELVV